MTEFNLNKPDEPRSQDLARLRIGKFIEGVLRRAVYLLVFFTAAFLLTLFAEHVWVADIVANLRAQLMIGIAACGLLTVLLKQWKWALLAITLVLIQLHWFLPHQTHSNANSENLFSVTTANVLTHNRRHDTIIKHLLETDPDLVAVLELSSELADRLATDPNFSTSHQHRIVEPQDHGNFGIGLYSKFPLYDAQAFPLNIEGILSIEATVHVAGKPVRVIATHPLPPVGKRNYDARNEHLDLLAGRLSQIRFENNEPMPLVVMGDLNLTPWSPVFSRFTKKITVHRVSNSFPATPTWHVKFPVFPLGLVLDHILVSKGISTHSYQVGPGIGSDHRSVSAVLSID